MATFDEYEAAIKANPDHYTTFVFSGRGGRLTTQHPTLAAALGHAQELWAAGVGGGRPVIIYAVQGRTQAVVQTYPTTQTTKDARLARRPGNPS